MTEDFQKKKSSKAIQNQFVFFYKTNDISNVINSLLKHLHTFSFSYLQSLTISSLKSTATQTFIAASDYISLSIEKHSCGSQFQQFPYTTKHIGTVAIPGFLVCSACNTLTSEKQFYKKIKQTTNTGMPYSSSYTQISTP